MSRGAWVGTWRPHRPRGPILAQFTSPGPKYCVQGATGYMSHLPTKRKAPAYSMHGVKPLLSKDCSPGPYYLNSTVTNRGREVGPSYTMTGRPRDRVEITPGPASYSPDRSNKIVYKSPPVHSLGYRTDGGRIDSTPSPNTYIIPEVLGPHSTAAPASPCYSIIGKNKLGRFDEDYHKTPGPAAYKKTDTEVYKKSAPKYTIGPRTKLLGAGKMTPGPADYELGKLSLTKSCAPLASFGIRHSDYTTPLIVDVY